MKSYKLTEDLGMGNLAMMLRAFDNGIMNEPKKKAPEVDKPLDKEVSNEVV